MEKLRGKRIESGGCTLWRGMKRKKEWGELLGGGGEYSRFCCSNRILFCKNCPELAKLALESDIVLAYEEGVHGAVSSTGLKTGEDIMCAVVQPQLHAPGTAVTGKKKASVRKNVEEHGAVLCTAPRRSAYGEQDFELQKLKFPTRLHNPRGRPQFSDRPERKGETATTPTTENSDDKGRAYTTVKRNDLTCNFMRNVKRLIPPSQPAATLQNETNNIRNTGAMLAKGNFTHLAPHIEA